MTEWRPITDPPEPYTICLVAYPGGPAWVAQYRGPEEGWIGDGGGRMDQPGHSIAWWAARPVAPA